MSNLCLNEVICARCGLSEVCNRDKLHKGFHENSRHRWDEYGDVAECAVASA